jgi:DtxR family transcriptional regulator, Mn-dependent transcriptional regulator
MPTSTVEDYVKAIYLLQEDSPSGEATVAGVAAALAITKGSVTSMVRKLCEAGLADAERYGGIRLTRRGRAMAIDIIRRHRLVEVFLVETLGLDWSEVHEEAERLEHALSAKVLDRLDAFLGRPSIDPHGDPIPDAEGNLADEALTPLSELEKGDRGEVARVSDQDPEFLEFAARHGLRPGERVDVVRLTPEAESIGVRAGGRTRSVSLSLSVASKFLIALDSS